jgi:hypothetical protein
MLTGCHSRCSDSRVARILDPDDTKFFPLIERHSGYGKMSHILSTQVANRLHSHVRRCRYILKDGSALPDPLGQWKSKVFKVTVSEQQLSVAIFSKSLHQDLESCLRIQVGGVGEEFDGRILLGHYTALQTHINDLRSLGHWALGLVEELKLLVEGFLSNPAVFRCFGFHDLLSSGLLADQLREVLCARQELECGIDLLDEAFIETDVRETNLDADVLSPLQDLDSAIEESCGCTLVRRGSWWDCYKSNGSYKPWCQWAAVEGLEDVEDERPMARELRIINLRDIVEKIQKEELERTICEEKQPFEGTWEKDEHQRKIYQKVKELEEMLEQDQRLRRFHSRFRSEYERLSQAIQDPSEFSLHELARELQGHRKAWGAAVTTMRRLSRLKTPSSVMDVLCFLCLSRAVPECVEDGGTACLSAFAEDLENWKQLYPEIEEVSRRLWQIPVEPFTKTTSTGRQATHTALLQLRDSVAVLVGQANGLFGLQPRSSSPMDLDVLEDPQSTSGDMPSFDSPQPAEAEKESPDRLLCPKIAIFLKVVTGIIFALVVYFVMGESTLSLSLKEYVS